jgi:hypothetical protein
MTGPVDELTNLEKALAVRVVVVVVAATLKSPPGDPRRKVKSKERCR